MEIVYRRRGVVEFCPKKEYLEKVLEEFRWVRRREELKRDRMFEDVVARLDEKIKLVTGDLKRVSFRFSTDGRKHHRGSRYILSWKGNLFKDLETKPVPDEYGMVEMPEEPHVQIAGIDELTAEGLLEGINLLLVQEILEL